MQKLGHYVHTHRLTGNLNLYGVIGVCYVVSLFFNLLIIELVNIILPCQPIGSLWYTL